MLPDKFNGNMDIPDQRSDLEWTQIISRINPRVLNNDFSIQKLNQSLFWIQHDLVEFYDALQRINGRNPDEILALATINTILLLNGKFGNAWKFIEEPRLSFINDPARNEIVLFPAIRQITKSRLFGNTKSDYDRFKRHLELSLTEVINISKKLQIDLKSEILKQLDEQDAGEQEATE